MAPRPWIVHIFKINGSALLLQALSKKPSTGYLFCHPRRSHYHSKRLPNFPKGQPGVQDPPTPPHPRLLDSRKAGHGVEWGWMVRGKRTQEAVPAPFHFL